MAKRPVATLAILATLSLACGGDNPSTPAAPPPPLALGWNDIPESSTTIKVGETKKMSFPLTAAVQATYTHSASNGNVTLAGKSPRAGIYSLEITGAQAGESEVTLTAAATGYTTASASFPVMVELRPLEWREIPDEITVEVGDQVEVRIELSADVQPEIRKVLSNDHISASVRCNVFGTCVVTVEGLSKGESTISVTATAAGYTEAMVEIDVLVEDPFDVSLWREMVFDGYECPNGTTDEICREVWGGRDVEQRITSVLPSQPDFHLVGRGRWKFSSFQEQTVRDAIRAGVEQATGDRFVGRITSGTDFVDRYGWVDVAAARDELWEDSGRRPPCGVAWIGATEGFIIINLDKLDVCDLSSLMLHEVGHALGFFHVLDLGDYIMSPYLTQIPPVFSEGEQLHAQLAWELGRGAPYTPDPRKKSSSARMTMTHSTPSRRGIRTLWDLPLGEMIHCRP